MSDPNDEKSNNCTGSRVVATILITTNIGLFGIALLIILTKTDAIILKLLPSLTAAVLFIAWMAIGTQHERLGIRIGSIVVDIIHALKSKAGEPKYSSEALKETHDLAKKASKRETQDILDEKQSF